MHPDKCVSDSFLMALTIFVHEAAIIAYRTNPNDLPSYDFSNVPLLPCELQTHTSFVSNILILITSKIFLKHGFLGLDDSLQNYHNFLNIDARWSHLLSLKNSIL